MKTATKTTKRKVDRPSATKPVPCFAVLIGTGVVRITMERFEAESFVRHYNRMAFEGDRMAVIRRVKVPAILKGGA